jgi:hypothetical protein
MEHDYDDAGDMAYELQRDLEMENFIGPLPWVNPMKVDFMRRMRERRRRATYTFECMADDAFYRELFPAFNLTDES